MAPYGEAKPDEASGDTKLLPPTHSAMKTANQWTEISCQWSHQFRSGVARKFTHGRPRTLIRFEGAIEKQSFAFYVDTVLSRLAAIVSLVETVGQPLESRRVTVANKPRYRYNFLRFFVSSVFSRFEVVSWSILLTEFISRHLVQSTVRNQFKVP